METFIPLCPLAMTDLHNWDRLYSVRYRLRLMKQFHRRVWLIVSAEYWHLRGVRKTTIIQTYNTRSKSRKFYREVRRLNEGYQPRSRTCEEKEVSLVGGKQEVLQRWIQYFQEILNKPSNSMSDSHIQYYALQKYVEKPTVCMVYNVIK
jgi:hypothetical protein